MRQESVVCDFCGSHTAGAYIRLELKDGEAKELHLTCAQTIYRVCKILKIDATLYLPEPNGVGFLIIKGYTNPKA